jgi:hypothetical protein
MWQKSPCLRVRCHLKAGDVMIFIVYKLFKVWYINFFLGCCSYASAEVDGITYYYSQSGAGYVSAYFGQASTIMFK